MDHIKLIYCTAVLLGLLHAWTRACEDLDPTSCATLISHSPGLCEEETFSYTTCPRTCGLCPLTCYHCEEPVLNYTDCTDTLACDDGQKCLLIELTSSDDGLTEYTMKCASVEMCDGRSLVGRRDLSLSCCTDDLCNKPDYDLTTDSPTVTTTSALLSTGTPKPKLTCARDVLIMFEDSTDGSSGFYIKEFLTNFVNSVEIGTDYSLMSFALFDNMVHAQWHLTNYVTTDSLIAVIENLQFRHRTNFINYNALSEYINDAWVGDRNSVPDLVIVIADHDGTAQGGHYGMMGMGMGMGMHAAMHGSSSPINNVVSILKTTQRLIAINVGDDASVANAFVDYATDIYNIAGHHELLNTLDTVLGVYCQ